LKKIYLLFLIVNCQLSIVNCKAQQGQWTWMNGSNLPNQPAVYGTQGVFAPANTPPALYEACEWTDLNGHFWLFGGTAEYNNLWQFDPAINQWAWMNGPGNVIQQPGVYGTQNVPSPTNIPGSRGWGAATFTDLAGDLWLMGGYGYDANSNEGNLNDLWKYNIATNEWTWMAGPTTCNNNGNYGTLLVPAPINNPPSRSEMNGSWVDNSGNLWYFGGAGLGSLSDMWRYNVSTNEWTWMSGPNMVNQLANYGTKGVPAAINTPGGRTVYAKWKDSNGNFWIFGGCDSILQVMNDLWRYDPTTGIWTWMSGTNVFDDPGTAGTQCVPDTSNIPAARRENRTVWTRPCDNFVSFGGFGTTVFGYNDLWNYNVGTNQWTWMSGSITQNVAGNYGTITVSSPANSPPSRGGSSGWIDTAGNLWVFGGYGYYNDMWRFVPDSTCPHLGTDTITSAFTAIPISGCNPLTVTFNNTSTNSTSYTWSIGNSTFSTTTNPTHTFTDSGTYIVRLIANAFCGIHADTSTMTITVNPSAAPVISGSMLCDSMPSILDAGTFISYNWSTGSTAETITVTTPNTYTVTVTNANGCTGTASRAITVNPNPTFTITGGDSLCAGSSLTIDAGPYSQYLWNNGTTTETNSVTLAGIYFVTVTDANGCKGVDSITITVNPSPVPVIIASGPTTFCQGDSVILSTTPFVNYSWSGGGATTEAITVKTSGNYLVTVTNAFGCTGTTSDSINVIQLPNVTSSFHADTTIGCSPLTIRFINTSFNGTSYLWRFGNGDTSTVMNPTYTFLDSGSYSITLITTNSGPCGIVVDSITMVDYIQVNVFHPTASFTSNYATPIYTGDSIHFQDQSYDHNGIITLWQWWFGDGTGTNFENPIHEWNLPGMYQVELIVTDNQGCKDSVLYDYIDVIEGIIEIPNTFSPNNDGYNDFFEIKASGIETFQLEIFNRWGMKLFTSNSINIMWDGYNENGLQCPDGTYYFVLKATGYTGNAFNRAGFIILLR